MFNRTRITEFCLQNAARSGSSERPCRYHAADGAIVMAIKRKVCGSVPDCASVGAADPGDHIGFVTAVGDAAVGAGEAAHGDGVLGEAGLALLAEH